MTTERQFVKIDNVNVYGLQESIIASGYPMATETIDMDGFYAEEKDFKRATKLGNAKPGSGHDCFLKGITVQADLTFSMTLDKQIKRYHFIDTVSSTSTMHRITKMDIRKQCNHFVASPTISMLEHLVEMYNKWDDNIDFIEFYIMDCFQMYGININNKKELFYAIVYNIPGGFCLTARYTTNYLQLKTIYEQRKHHKLDEWHELCDWMLTLPHFKEFCVK